MKMKYFTKEWYIHGPKDATKMEQLDKSYIKQISTMNPLIPKELLRNIHLHDTIVKDTFFTGGDYSIEVDTVHSGLTAVEKVVFSNAKIAVDDHVQKGDVWLYEEVYPKLAGYETHILFCDRCENPKELIIQSNDIWFCMDKMKHDEFQNIRLMMETYRNSPKFLKEIIGEQMRKYHLRN